jgi:hypothetical protein
MFEPGDKFIRFSKYGGTRMGVVKFYGERYSVEMNPDYKVRMVMPYIITENGIPLNLDGTDGQIYKVDHEYSEEEYIKCKEFFKPFGNKNPFNESKRSNRGLGK